MPQLYEMPNETRVRVLSDVVKVPPGAPLVLKGEIIKFHHIDGMYSYCHNDQDQLVHLAAWTEVELV